MCILVERVSAEVRIRLPLTSKIDICTGNISVCSSRVDQPCFIGKWITTYADHGAGLTETF